MTTDRMAEIDELIRLQQDKRLTAVTAYNAVVPELLAEVRRLAKAVDDFAVAYVPNLEARVRAVLSAVVAALTDDERIALLDGYCRECGTADLPCHCTNDE